ncbi:MAG: hypothetical protein ACYC4L_07595 [Chloroflexota bacterium]
MADDRLGKQLGEAARAVDEHGKRVWRDNEPDLRAAGRVAGHVAAIVANLVALYVLNNLLAWHVPFLTEAFIAPLAVFNLSIAASIVAHAVFLAYEPRWFRLLVQTGLNVLGLAAVGTMYIVFPLDFGATGWEPFARFALLATIVAIGIATVIEALQLLFSGHRN